MRTEKEIMNLILAVAKSDPRIRAAYMNGSRTNPNVPKDKHRDYDVVYVVTETKTFLDDREWLKAFGEPLIVQEPDNNDLGWGTEHDYSRSYAWLMLFMDGTRIDLGIQVKEKMQKEYMLDKLTVSLMDKDRCLPNIAPPTDEDYHVKRPTDSQYRGCCNEFWWCLNNVAKGIARDELPYAMTMYHVYVRDMLDKMIEWYIGISTDFSVSAGKMGKYFKKYLPPSIYEMYADTYSDSSYEHFWASIFVACRLFHTVALPVAEFMGFSYHQGEEDGMMLYLQMVKQDGALRGDMETGRQE